MTRQRLEELPGGDWRRRSDDFTGERFERNPRVATGLTGLAERRDVSCSAVAWVLSCPGVTGAIAGARSPDQLTDWVTASELELTRDELDEIAAFWGAA
jgi:aryl-alcohol dehydrogenase-like predicted oxidoreductase